jgi:hypothetical protein
MEPIKIPFGEWLPDLPDYQNPGVTVAKNVIPAGQSYQSMPSQVIYSNALTARCQGAFSTKDADGNTVNFAGDATKLYRMASTAYADVSKVGGYTIGSDEQWYWTRFNSLLLATNINDPIQKFTVNSSTIFADLSVGAPKARYIATSGSFVIAGNTYDAIDGNVPERIRWCALGDPTDWTVSAVTQADYEDLDISKGWVMQLVGGEYIVVFQERAITRLDYTGSPGIFQIRQIEGNHGTLIPGSVVRSGNLIFYIGLDGFYVFDGNQSISIGANKVDKTFWAEVDTSYFSRVTATAHPDAQLIVWAIPVTGNTMGRTNRFYIYNYSPNAQNRWTIVDGIDIELIYTSLSEGYTLDSMDAIYPNIDTMLFSLDSRILTGENYILSGFDSNHKQINFTGAAMDAVIETQEFQVFPGNRAEVSVVRPIVDGSGTVTMQMGTRDIHSESVTYDSVSAVDSIGECQMRSNARYHRARVNITGGFNDAQGIEIIEAAKAGRR